MSIAPDFPATGTIEVWASDPKPQTARTLFLVLDAICDLRAADEAYGPGDSYFGQSLAEVYDRLPQLSAIDICSAAQRLVTNGQLRAYAAEKAYVWVSNAGWRNWSRWDYRLAYLLANERPLPR
jgi:hypothetical protein